MAPQQGVGKEGVSSPSLHAEILPAMSGELLQWSTLTSASCSLSDPTSAVFSEHWEQGPPYF